MPAQFTEGDLFAAEGIRAWAHGCNCAGSMGAGIAVEFKRRFPLGSTPRVVLVDSGRRYSGVVLAPTELPRD